MNSGHRIYGLFVIVLALQSPQDIPGKEDVTFQLTGKLEFKGRQISGGIKKSEIDALLNLPVKNGDSDPASGFGVELTRDDGSTLVAQTCNEWQKARSAGAYASTTYDMSMESFMIHTCGVLFELRRAMLPRTSFVQNVTLASLSVLPADMLAEVGDDEDAEKHKRASTSVAGAVRRRDIHKSTRTELRLRYSDLDQIFQEAVRADFNGDGTEDVLVSGGAHAVGGTMRLYWYLILTRKKAAGMLEILPALHHHLRQENSL